METQKNKVGRPRKEPTYTQSFRASRILKVFYNEIEQESTNQPSLFEGQ